MVPKISNNFDRSSPYAVLKKIKNKIKKNRRKKSNSPHLLNNPLYLSCNLTPRLQLTGEEEVAAATKTTGAVKKKEE